MSLEFFSNPDRKKRLAIRNPETRKECKKYLENEPDGSKIPDHLWKAEDEAHSHLASLFQDFLKLKGGNFANLKNFAENTYANLRGKLEF